MIKFRCSNCSKKIGVPLESAGKRVKCPRCTFGVMVPHPESELELTSEPASESICTDDLLNRLETPVVQQTEKRDFTTTDAETPSSQKQPSYLTESSANNLGALVYPLRGGGKYLLLAYIVVLLALRLLSSLPFINFLVGIIALLFALYVNAYLVKIITSSAAGEGELPDWPDITAFWDDIIRPVILVLWTVAVVFGPAIIYYLFLTPHVPRTDNLFWCLIVLGCFYFPMALLAVVLHDSWFALNPIIIIPSIIKVLKAYLVSWIILLLVVGSYYFLGKIDLAIPYLHTVLSFYLQIVAMRIIGLIYFKNEKYLGWF